MRSRDKTRIPRHRAAAADERKRAAFTGSLLPLGLPPLSFSLSSPFCSALSGHPHSARTSPSPAGSRPLSIRLLGAARGAVEWRRKWLRAPRAGPPLPARPQRRSDARASADDPNPPRAPGAGGMGRVRRGTPWTAAAASLSPRRGPGPGPRPPLPPPAAGPTPSPRRSPSPAVPAVPQVVPRPGHPARRLAHIRRLALGSRLRHALPLPRRPRSRPRAPTLPGGERTGGARAGGDRAAPGGPRTPRHPGRGRRWIRRPGSQVPGPATRRERTGKVEAECGGRPTGLGPAPPEPTPARPFASGDSVRPPTSPSGREVTPQGR